MCSQRSSTPPPTPASGRSHSPRPDEAADRREPLAPGRCDLGDVGHDAVHVTAVGLGSTNDEVILRAAADDGSIILTADADFGTLLALRAAHRPSVLMLRSSDHLNPDQQAELIAAAIGRVEGELDQGAIASVTPERIRLRTLPIATD